MMKKNNKQTCHHCRSKILYRRAELADQYDVLHRLLPSFEQIEQELARSLSMNEKKCLINDDYSMIDMTVPVHVTSDRDAIDRIQTTQDVLTMPDSQSTDIDNNRLSISTVRQSISIDNLVEPSSVLFIDACRWTTSTNMHFIEDIIRRAISMASQRCHYITSNDTSVRR
jgi:hypothetical protein